MLSTFALTSRCTAGRERSCSARVGLQVGVDPAGNLHGPMSLESKLCRNFFSFLCAERAARRALRNLPPFYFYTAIQRFIFIHAAQGLLFNPTSLCSTEYF